MKNKTKYLLSAIILSLTCNDALAMHNNASNQSTHSVFKQRYDNPYLVNVNTEIVNTEIVNTDQSFIDPRNIQKKENEFESCNVKINHKPQRQEKNAVNVRGDDYTKSQLNNLNNKGLYNYEANSDYIDFNQSVFKVLLECVKNPPSLQETLQRVRRMNEYEVKICVKELKKKNLWNHWLGNITQETKQEKIQKKIINKNNILWSTLIQDLFQKSPLFASIDNFTIKVIIEQYLHANKIPDTNTQLESANQNSVKPSELFNLKSKTISDIVNNQIAITKEIYDINTPLEGANQNNAKLSELTQKLYHLKNLERIQRSINEMKILIETKSTFLNINIVLDLVEEVMLQLHARETRPHFHDAINLKSVMEKKLHHYLILSSPRTSNWSTIDEQCMINDIVDYMMLSNDCLSLISRLLMPLDPESNSKQNFIGFYHMSHVNLKTFNKIFNLVNETQPVTKLSDKLSQPSQLSCSIVEVLMQIFIVSTAIPLHKSMQLSELEQYHIDQNLQSNELMQILIRLTFLNKMNQYPQITLEKSCWEKLCCCFIC